MSTSAAGRRWPGPRGRSDPRQSRRAWPGIGTSAPARPAAPALRAPTPSTAHSRSGASRPSTSSASACWCRSRTRGRRTEFSKASPPSTSDVATRSLTWGISPWSGAHCTRHSVICASTHALDDREIRRSAETASSLSPSRMVDPGQPEAGAGVPRIRGRHQAEIPRRVVELPADVLALSLFEAGGQGHLRGELARQLPVDGGEERHRVSPPPLRQAQDGTPPGRSPPALARLFRVELLARQRRTRRRRWPSGRRRG